MKGKHYKKNKLHKKILAFLLIYFAFFTLYLTINTLSKYTGVVSKSGGIGVAKWDVSVNTEGQADTLRVITGGSGTSYILRVTSNSDVAVTYNVVLSGLPEGVQVAIDGGANQTPTNGSITFTNVGSFTANDVNNTNSHTIVFSVPIGVNVTQSSINIYVVFNQNTI